MIAKAKARNNRTQSQIANRLRVLRLIYSSRPFSQRGIVLETELQASTISNIISEFLDMDLIIEGESLERGGVGPRETILEINPRIAGAIGVNLHAAKQEICLIGSDGNILAEHQIEQGWTNRTLAQIAKKIRQLAEAAGLSLKNIKGVGLAIPGIVDNDTGVTILSRALQLENYPMLAQFSELIELPVLIDRNVNYGSYLEQHLNPTLTLQNSGYLLISKVKTHQGREEYSVGMSLTLDGKIYRGTNHAAGELDTVLLPSDDNSVKRSGRAFYEKFGSHLASAINLLDIGHLMVVSDEQTLSGEDFKVFSDALNNSLIPISNRSFQLSLSTHGISGITRGAALYALHQHLEARLGQAILIRKK